jgi:hypothetical protein
MEHTPLVRLLGPRHLSETADLAQRAAGRWNVPDPLRPEKRPDVVQFRLPADPIQSDPIAHFAAIM